MKKRALSLLLAAVLVCALLPTAALAATVTQVVPCKYGEVRAFHDGLAAVHIGSYLTEKWGFIDTTGKEVVPRKYDYVRDFQDGLAAVMSGGLYREWGFIDATGREVVPCKYDDVEDFHDGLAKVELRYGRGFIDTTGKEVVPIGKYGEVKGFSDGLAAVYLGGKWGFIDTTGKEVVPCKYDEVEDFHEGLAAVKGNTGEVENGKTVYKWGFVDATGREVAPCKYDKVGDFSDGLAWVRLGDEVGFIDATGREVVPCKYNKVEGFSDGLAKVWLDGKVGFIDATGQEVVPIGKYGKYGKVEDFHEGLAAVELNGKWGFVDTTGKEVVPIGKYDAVDGFSDGLAVVRGDSGEKDGWGNPIYKWGFIDKTGKEVVPCKYYGALSFSEGLAAVRLDGKGWGYIDLQGNEVIPCQYGEPRSSREGMLAVDLDGMWGFVRVEGLPAAPGTSAPVTPAANTAYASTQTVLVDGKPVVFNAYALKDANGYDTNYIKLRDVADVLNGSAAQFQVGWDGSIAITTGQSYTKNGTEMVQNFSGNQSYTVSTSPVTVNGAPTNLEAITLTDASGGGYTYFKLRDLGTALGFKVDWSAEKGIFIETK